MGTNIFGDLPEEAMGIAMMAIKQEAVQKNMTILPWTEEKLVTTIVMIWHKNKLIYPARHAFTDTVRETVNSPENG